MGPKFHITSYRVWAPPGVQKGRFGDVFCLIQGFIVVFIHFLVLLYKIKLKLQCTKYVPMYHADVDIRNRLHKGKVLIHLWYPEP